MSEPDRDPVEPRTRPDLERFGASFPLRIYLNRGSDHDDRYRTEAAATEHGLGIARSPIPNAARGMADRDRTRRTAIRLALRQARQWQSPSLLLIRDDLEWHPHLEEVFAACGLPADWGVLVLGGEHAQRPVVLGGGVVRITELADLAAVAIRHSHYQLVAERLRRISRAATRESADADDVDSEPGGHLAPLLPVINALAGQLVVHGVHPALFSPCPRSPTVEASESGRHRSGASSPKSEGDSSGRQRECRFPGLDAEALGVSRWRDGGGSPACFAPGHQIAFLFLTRSDPNHPLLWEEYFEGHESARRIYTHAKHPEAMRSGPWLDGLVAPLHATEWGTVSLVRATLELLRAALRDEANAFFVLCSESCVPIKPFSELAHLLSFDARGMIGRLDVEAMGRINPWIDRRLRGAPRIPRRAWRFHSQWFLINREMAEVLVSVDLTHEFRDSFAPDESYFATVLQVMGYPLDERSSPSEPTFVKWNAEARGHPETFGEITPGFAAELARSPHYFARKFAPESNIRSFGLHWRRRM